MNGSVRPVAAMMLCFFAGMNARSAIDYGREGDPAALMFLVLALLSLVWGFRLATKETQ